MSGGVELKVTPSQSPEVNRKEQSNYELHRLEHYQQRYHWDCGLSCCFMVMRRTDRDFVLSNLTKFVEEEGFGDSTWTIDLCYILRRFNVLFRYTTITIGVDPGYSKEAFYDKVLAKDNARVNDRFNDSSENGMVILEKSVTLDDILEHLEKTGPVIILTNANLLTCSQCSNYSSCYQFCFSARVSYQGHYIVLVGFNSKSKQILYRNPSVKDKVCYMSFDCLEESRTSYGTDEDILFIFPP